MITLIPAPRPAPDDEPLRLSRPVRMPACGSRPQATPSLGPLIGLWVAIFPRFRQPAGDDHAGGSGR